MKVATVRSVCECQAKLGAELDARQVVVRGWAFDPKRGQELVAPANRVGTGTPHFDVAWFCPFCTRNTLRSFDTSALCFSDANPS